MLKRALQFQEPHELSAKSPMGEKRTITKSVRLLLQPIIRLLIELGFNFRDFNEIAKTVYVEVASEQYGIKGRKTNMSRVAIMTGLTRREVSRLRNVIEHDPLDLPTPKTVVANVLSAWHQERRYLNCEGKPLSLPINGDDSLTSLIDRYRGDIPSTALIKELQRVKAISVRGNSAVVESTSYVPLTLKDESIERFGSVLYDVANTITENLLTARNSKNTRLEHRATEDRVSVHSCEAFRRFLDRKAHEFLTEVNGWLSDHKEESRSVSGLRLGVGVYSIAGERKSDI